MILKIAALIILIVACLISFYNLGYVSGARERKDRWLTDERLLDSLSVIQKGIGEIQLKQIKLFLKDRDHNENNEQQ